MSALVSAPLARARLHDLCFEGRWGRVGDLARLAGEAYLDVASELAQGETSDQLRAVRALRQCEALRRARILARLTGQADLGKRAADAVIDVLREVLAADPLDLGRAIVLLETAIDEELPGQEIEDLLNMLRSETRDIFFTESEPGCAVPITRGKGHVIAGGSDFGSGPVAHWLTVSRLVSRPLEHRRPPSRSGRVPGRTTVASTTSRRRASPRQVEDDLSLANERDRR